MYASFRIFSKRPVGRGWRVGLTGGIGAGKSTVLRCFGERGWAVVDADEVVRELLKSDSEVHQELESCWGAQVLLPEGGVDRAFLGKIVFSNPSALKELEAILHPRVHARWMAEMDAAGERNAIAEIPLLFEKDLETHFDWTVCLAISEERQLSRLSGRGMDKDAAQARIARQLPTCEKVKRADIVLSNEGSASFLNDQLNLLVSAADGV